MSVWRKFNSPLFSGHLRRNTIAAASVPFDTSTHLIAVDKQDVPIGIINKLQAHSYFGKPFQILKTDATEGDGALMAGPVLHRAFSVFHFDTYTPNTVPHLLLTQRSHCKATFPSMWTNTCCSHPIWEIPKERGSNKGGDEETIVAVKNAAVRRLMEELNISLDIEDLTYITRVLYMAKANENYAEYEMDYVLVSNKSASFQINPMEVRDTKWVTLTELQHMLDSSELQFTPWSRYIFNSILLSGWGKLHNLASTPGLNPILDAGIL